MKISDLDFNNIIEKLKNRVPVQSEYFYEILPKELRKLAFTVSDIETVRTITMIKNSLANAQREGLSFKNWRDRLDKKVLNTLTDQRLETVYRTNMSTSYNSARRMNASFSRVTPYLMLNSLNDSRARHSDLDGVIKRADSEFWNYNTPPLYYNCRCSLIPLTEEEAKRRGISRLPNKNMVKPNFGRSTIGNVTSTVMKEASQLIDTLPKEYKNKISEKQKENQLLVDTWYKQNENIFKGE